MPDDKSFIDLEEEVKNRQEAAIGALQGVQTSLTALATEMSKRPTDVDLKKDRRVERIFFVAVLLVIGIPLLLNSFANRRTAGQIVECTSPGEKTPTSNEPFNTGHACYDRNKENTNQILVDAGSIIISVVECDRQNRARPDAEFESCVAKVLAERLRA